MILKRAVFLAVFMLALVGAEAQINLYLGGNLEANYSWIRGDDHTFEPGFGGGFSFVYWEFEYWFLKAGLNYTNRSSTHLDYPDPFGVEPLGPDDKINISTTEQTLGIPLTVYFRPYESGANSLLLAVTSRTQIVVNLKEQAEGYDDVVLGWSEVNTRTKTSFGLGVGYQRQLDKHMFLNILPTYNMDLRSDRPFNSFILTAELIFGVY